MNNRNFMMFLLSLAALFGIYSWVASRYAPMPNPPETQTQAPPPQQPPAEVKVVPAVPVATNTKDVFILENSDVKVSWRKQDGAIQQVEWKVDGTRFFPSHKTDGDGKEIAKDFPGIGGALGTRFEGEPEVAPTAGGRTIVFRNAGGERLEYRLPDQGHVLDVRLFSAKAHLNLVPMFTDIKEAYKLGRVFTMDEKSVEAVAWSSILSDPFFSFLGAKRKELPPENSRVGLDAGVEEKGNSQANQYFAAIWEMGRTAKKDVRGYHVEPDAQGQASARLYLGPKQAEALMAFGKPYTKVMDFGTFGLVAQFMFWILRTIQRAVPNWGWAVVVFSLLLRFALWPLNTKTTISMLRMKELEPHQKALQAKYEKFGNDMTKKAEMQKELMDFYKKNGHSPMGGCLPMLLQMPVFLALWSTLNNVFELRQAPFIFWIQDLSGKDPFYVLPVLLGATMIIQQVMTPAMGDPTQRKMMMFMMPAMMIFFFASTPAGLCVYYLVFNLVGMLQTWWVKRTYKPQPVIV